VPISSTSESVKCDRLRRHAASTPDVVPSTRMGAPIAACVPSTVAIGTSAWLMTGSVVQSSER